MSQADYFVDFLVFPGFKVVALVELTGLKLSNVYTLPDGAFGVPFVIVRGPTVMDDIPDTNYLLDLTATVDTIGRVRVEATIDRNLQVSVYTCVRMHF